MFIRNEEIRELMAQGITAGGAIRSGSAASSYRECGVSHAFCRG
jgi:uncharacterized protein YoaH (UPF0181 family)